MSLFKARKIVMLIYQLTIPTKTSSSQHFWLAWHVPAWQQGSWVGVWVGRGSRLLLLALALVVSSSLDWEPSRLKTLQTRLA